MQGLIPDAYAPFACEVFSSLGQPAAVTMASDVAQAIWLAVNDVSDRLHFPAGADAVALFAPRQLQQNRSKADI